MKIVITGGTGLIGRALCSALLNHHHEVWVVSRNPQLTALPAGCKAARWDGRTSQGWEEASDGADAIINLAGESLAAGRWDAARKERIRSSRVLAGQAVVEAVKKATIKPKLVLQISGIGAYGPLDDRIVDESAPYGSDYLSSVTVDWEASTRQVQELGVRQVVLRTGIVLSTQGGALKPLLLATRFFLGGALGNGKQWWSWIHIDDQVGAILHLLAAPGASGVYNLCSPNPVQMAEFGRTLASVLDRPYWLPVPSFGLKILLGEMSTVVLDGQRAMPKRLLESGYRFKYEKLHSALVNLFAPAGDVRLE
jgi:hypothetical protein